MQGFVNDEFGRLDALRRTGLLDKPPSRAFDRIVAVAARLFNVPTSLISLVDQDRQWFKARIGFALNETPRCDALCDHTIRGSTVLVVEDASRHPVFWDNPLVTAPGGLRFYAGAPLITFDGYAIGTLCVADSAPRSFTADDARILQELAEMVMIEIELRHSIGRIDPVTMLPNRPQFRQDFGDVAKEHAGQRWTLVVFNLSAEHATFSLRALGLSFFETFICRLLIMARPHVPADATVYHIGAITFCYMLPTSLDEALVSASTLIEVMRWPIECNGIPLAAPVCGGLYSFTAGEVDPENAIRMAFSAAHNARRTEQLCTAYDAEKDVQERRSYRLLMDAAAALRAGGQMMLHFQPRMAVGSGLCIGVEALVRWSHPLLGPVSPGEFIPLIEATSLIRQLTEWVVDQSLAQAARWRDAGTPLKVSINVSGRNLDEPDFVLRLQAALLRYDIPPSLIELEFTESALASNGDRARLRLEQIRAMGIEIAIDDFGTGYSNLSYLQKLPSRVLKLDQSFIRALATDLRDQTIVRSTINMAHELGYRVVAEGVETKEIMNIITALGCDEVQGYLFAKPMPAEEIARGMVNTVVPFVSAARRIAS